MKYDGVLSGDVYPDSCQCTERTLHRDEMNVKKKKNRKLKYVKLRNVKSRTANWQDHGETQLQKCTTSRHNWIDLWVMQSERQRSMKEEWGCKWEGKAGDEERDEGDQNEGGEGGCSGWQMALTQIQRGVVMNCEIPLSWDKQGYLHSSCQWFNTYAAPASFLSNQIHALIHIPRVVSSIGLNTAHHVFPSVKSLFGKNLGTWPKTSDSWLLWG